MITNFKIFEDLFSCASRVPVVGDYVIFQLKDYITHKFKFVKVNADSFPSISLNDMYEFFNINIGEIIKMEESGIGYNIGVKYDKDIFEFSLMLSEIRYCSKDKNELESLISAKKYNL